MSTQPQSEHCWLVYAGYFALAGTDHPSHQAQGSMIRRYIIWRNKHADDERLREIMSRANAA